MILLYVCGEHLLGLLCFVLFFSSTLSPVSQAELFFPAPGRNHSGISPWLCLLQAVRWKPSSPHRMGCASGNRQGCKLLRNLCHRVQQPKLLVHEETHLHLAYEVIVAKKLKNQEGYLTYTLGDRTVERYRRV